MDVWEGWIPYIYKGMQGLDPAFENLFPKAMDGLNLSHKKLN